MLSLNRSNPTNGEQQMASQKQIDANRRNAQLSTGPRSAAGKARSRLNALRDGLTGQIATLSGKDRAVFEKHKAEMIAGFDPQTPIERELAHAIAWDTWRLNHLRAIEMNVYALGVEENFEAGEEYDDTDPDDFDAALSDARTFRAEAKRLELMSLYEQRMNRGIHRNLATLRDLQAERKRNYERDKQEEVRIARLHEFNEMPIRPSARPSRNGFVFSSAEIARAAVRQRYLETADWVKKNANPRHLYGNLTIGCGDSYFDKLAHRQGLTAEEWKEFLGVPPETSALHRLDHPEEYGLQTQ